MEKLAAFEAYRTRPSRETLLELLRAYEHPVYNVCRHILQHDQDAEDAAQKAFLEILDGVSRIRDGDHFRRWVHQVAFHSALKAKRARKTRLEHERNHVESIPPAALPEESVEALYEHLAALDDDLRSLIVDHYFERRSLQSLAAEKGCSTVAIWKKLQRARESLRSSLAGAGLAAVVPGMENFLGAITPFETASSLITSAVAAKAAAVAGGSVLGPFLLIGGTLVKAKSLIAMAALVLAALAGFVIVRQRAPRPISEERLAQPLEQPPTAPVAAQAEAPPSPPVLPENAPGPAIDTRTALNRLITALRHGNLEDIKKAQQDLLASLLPKPVPDDENAAVLYRKAFAALSKPTPEEYAVRQAVSDGTALTAEQIDTLKAFLEKNRDALSLAREAAARSQCNFEIDYSKGFDTPLPHLSPLMGLMHLLACEAVLAGDGLARMDLSHVLARSADALAGEPCLVAQLVRCQGYDEAVRILGTTLQGPTDADALRKLMGSNYSDGIRNGFERAMAGEIYSATEFLTSGNPEGTALGLPVRPFAPGDPLTAQDVSHLADVLTEYMSLINRPFYESREDIARVERAQWTTEARKETAPLPDRELSKMILPSILKIAERQARTEANAGTLRIGAAAQLYRLQFGAYPASLDELRCIMPEIPIDPCSGRPYVYRQEEAGFLVYSVGPDGVDNGGVTRFDELHTVMQDEKSGFVVSNGFPIGTDDITFRAAAPPGPR